MSLPVIQIEGLGKRYRIEAQRTIHHNLRRIMTQWVRRPFGKRQSRPAGHHIWALKDVSLDVNPGEILGIIGQNGAGKSTLLKILSRITSPTEGSVRLRGRISSLLEVGTGFHPELTGRENVFLNGSILGMSRAEINRKFEEIVEFAEVEQFLDTPVKWYSSGMYVRLAFAVAAHLEPDILLCDEVLAVGDAAFRRKCLGKMDGVVSEGRTVLFVSHSMQAIQRLCGRVVLFDRGRITQCGPAAEVVETYLTMTSGADEAGGGDLLEVPRIANLSGGVRLSRCEILNADRKPTGRLRFGEPFTVHIEAVAQTLQRDLSVVVAIETPEEIRITNDLSEESDVLFEAGPGKPMSIDVSFHDLVLTPRTYGLTVGIRKGNVGLDKLNRCARFEVMGVAYEGTAPHTGSWGFVRAQPTWQEAAQPQPAVI